jgi:RNA polymerase sigma-70 factor (ECF subfamily)
MASYSSFFTSVLGPLPSALRRPHVATACMTDAERFEAFVLEFQDMVFATAVRLLGNAAEAEDIAQTVFLKAFERFGAAGPGPAAAGWLKTVATNACLNHLTRYRARWRLFSELGRDGGEDDGRDFEAALASDASAAADVERADENARIEAALRQLPDHQRVPLVLFHFEQRSYQEIAGHLGVSVGKVKTDIHRGREALRSRFTSEYGPR